MQSLKEITNDFKRVISYSQEFEVGDSAVDTLMARWYEAKKEFINLFGDDCIYTFPTKVSFELDEKEKAKRVDEFIAMLECNYDLNDLADFVFEMRNSFFSNLVAEDYTYNDIKITKGTKLIKSFKHFVLNPTLLEYIQNEASRIIQEDKVEGYLHLSVHPLDFLSASENVHNWRSCHALDGDWRAGNLNYMVDDSTIICYLSTDKKEKLPSFPEDVKWNSKKWRVWLFISHDREMMFAGRQYPFNTSTGLDMITKLLFPQLNGYYSWSDWRNNYIKSYKRGNQTIHLRETYIPVGEKLRTMKNLIFNCNHKLFYNDLLESSTYTAPYYCYNSISWFAGDCGDTSDDTVFYIGENVKCLRCGEKVLTESNSMLCDDCYHEIEKGHLYCEMCDRQIPLNEAVMLDSGPIICPSCARDYTTFCEVCGTREPIHSMIFDHDREKWMCAHCFNKLREEED